MTASRVTGIVLAAGGSSRLGTSKHVLPYRDTTVLGATLDTVRACGLDQIIVTLGGGQQAVRDAVSLEGVEVVALDDFGAEFGAGCSASLRVALGQVDPQALGIVLMLGDQPGVRAAVVRRLISEGTAGPVTVCRYTDGIGHPFWLSRSIFGELAGLHGDKGVWKLIHSGRHPVGELVVDGPVPLDVDTWDDYRRLVESVPT